MKKLAFKMYLKEGTLATYKKRHQEIWPELKTLLKSSGIENYSIYYDQETNCVYAFQTCEELDSQALGANVIVQKWWKFMSDIMETNSDFSPKQSTLIPVFDLDQPE